MARKDWHRPSEFSAPQNMRRVSLTLRYNGSLFCGWQSQNNERSVQDELEKAVLKLTGLNEVSVVGSGRTDSGVHAMGQVAHIEIPASCTMPDRAFLHGLNSFLPEGVRVTRALSVENSFHARYSAMAREYRYFWAVVPEHDPFAENLVSRLREFPDTELLNSYARIVRGTHDFTTFCGAGDQSPSKFRDIYFSDFSMIQSMYGYPVLCYRICGNAFLYHMVRSLAGTMIQMAAEKKTAEEFGRILEARDRSLCGKTAPASGLYLWRISYDPEEFRWFEDEYAGR